MRKEKWEELRTYIREFETVKVEKVEKVPPFFEKLEELKGYLRELEVIKEKDPIEFLKRWEEIQLYIQGLEAVKFNQAPRFVNSETYKVTLRNGDVVVRDKIIKGRAGNEHPGAAIILPITKEGNVPLVVQPRVFTKSTVGVEIPAGYIDRNENPLVSAKRELEEETAFQSDNWIQLGSGWYQDDGCSDSYNYSYLATNCEETGVLKRDKDEFIRIFECNIEEAYELLEKGYIAGCGGAITFERAKPYIKRL